MSAELKPMQWPMPVPMLLWKGDYADIRERIRRCGRFDTEEVWEPHSGDSWEAFCSEHGGVNLFEADWRELERREREAGQRYEHRQNELVQQAQERWEAERRQRQQAKDAVAEEEWRAAKTVQRTPQPARVVPPAPTMEEDKARALHYWSGVDPAYAQHQYHLVAVRKTLTHLYGTTFVAGHAYWVPTPVMFAIRGHGG